MKFKEEQFYARVFTASNYNNVNGKLLPVHEIYGRRVTCYMVRDNKPYYADFSIGEVTEFKDQPD